MTNIVKLKASFYKLVLGLGPSEQKNLVHCDPLSRRLSPHIHNLQVYTKHFLIGLHSDRSMQQLKHLIKLLCQIHHLRPCNITKKYETKAFPQ